MHSASNGVSAAIIGCGKATEGKEGWAIGAAHAGGYRAVLPDVPLYAVDINPDNLRAFGDRFELPAAHRFNSTEALYEALTPTYASVCTWPGLHLPMVVEAADAGVKGVICEKPVAMNGLEIEQMLRHCEAKGTRLAVAHQRAYNADFATLKRLIASGRLSGDGPGGLTLEARVGDRWDMLSWSVHWFDMASWLFDADIESVMCGLDHTGERRYRHAVENESIVHLRFPGRREAILVTGPDVVSGVGFEVRGQAGVARPVGDAVELFTREGFERVAVDPVEHEGFAGMVAEFHEAVQSGGACRLDADRSARATAAVFAAHESARTMRRVSLPTPLRFAPLEISQRPPHAALPFRRVTLATDAHHTDEATGLGGRDGLELALRAALPDDAEIHHVRVEEAPLAPADLETADLLVLYHTQQTTAPETREAIEPWVRAGKPVAVVHCGVGAYADWPEYRKWIGRYWVWGGEDLPPSGHPHEPATLHVTDPGRYQPGWREAWLPRDEVYVDLADAAPVHELLVARMGDREVPAAWQTVDHPHVVTFAHGHRYDIYATFAMRSGIAATLRRLADETA